MYTPLLSPFPFTTPHLPQSWRLFHLLLVFRSLFSLPSVARLSLLWAALSCGLPCPPDSLLLGSPSVAPWVLLFAGHLWSSLCLLSTTLSFAGLLFFFYYDSYLLVPKRRDRTSQCSEHAFLSFSINVFSDPIKQNMLFHPSRLLSSCFPSSLSLPYQFYSCSRCSGAPASK